MSSNEEVFTLALVQDHNSKLNEGKILLCGGMLQRGVTIKKCDVVYILNNTVSYSKYIQCI